jgi:hypothetical protein
MSRTYITGVGRPQEKHLVPAYAALVASSIELRSDDGQVGSNPKVRFADDPATIQRRHFSGWRTARPGKGGV